MESIECKGNYLVDEPRGASYGQRCVPKKEGKPKLNLTVRDESRVKLEKLAELEKRSVSNLVEIMADERWERLADMQGLEFTKLLTTIAHQIRLDLSNPAERRRFRKAVLAHLLKQEPEPAKADGARGQLFP